MDLSEAKIGDSLLLTQKQKCATQPLPPVVQKVKKVTKTQIVTQHYRFNKTTGVLIG